MNACHQSSPTGERGTMRSMVEREAPPADGNALHNRRQAFARPFSRSASLSTTLRVVPLSQAGEA